jgi:small conductance mechanosensitive channel
MEKLEGLIPVITSYGTRIIGVLVLILVAWMVAARLQGVVHRQMTQRDLDATLTGFVSKLVRWGVILVAVIASLGVFGVETTSFAAVLGAAGLAIGMAFQGSLSHVAAGVMLMTFRPFSVGDVVNAAGVVGKVIEIGLFSTTLDTPDNRRIIVPNGAIFGATIENVTFHDQRRVDVGVGTDYGADLAMVRGVLEKTASAVPGVLSDPAPQIFLAELGGSSIDWQVRVWCDTSAYWDVFQATTHAVKDALDEANVGIPFPQMDVHLDGGLDKA